MSNTIIEILIDRSGSMGYMNDVPNEKNKYLVNGETRMTIVKKILLSEIVPTIDFASRVIIRSFRTNNSNQGGKKTSTIYTPLVYDGPFNRSLLQTKINSLPNPPAGGTPITAAIEAAIKDLQEYDTYDRKIILLTDGEENGGGDYKEAAKKALMLKGVPCKIFIVGLNQSENDEKKSREIATGGYVNVTTKSYDTLQVRSALAALKIGVLQNSLQNTIISSELPTTTNSANEKEVIKSIEAKIDTIKGDAQHDSEIVITSLEKKLKDHFINGEKLLSELSSLKELIRVGSMLQSGVDSTTLTIDSEYSESVRKRSESFLFKFLCEKYGTSKVKWLNDSGESGSHHDFELLDNDGNTILLIECKGTPRNKSTFYLTSHEWTNFLKNRQIYQVYRVFNVDDEMNAVCIDNLLEAILSGQVVPYLSKPEVLKEGRVFLTLTAH